MCTSKRHGADFLHNPSTGESVWYTGWIERKSKWYGRKYFFQPTTGRAEWEIPTDSTDFISDSAEKQRSVDVPSRHSVDSAKLSMEQQEPIDHAPAQSKEKVQSWKAKILAMKAKAKAVDETPKKQPHDEASSDDMEVDKEIVKEVEQLPRPPEIVHPTRPDQDLPSVALRRERLRIECLDHFANENQKYGNMTGYSKTSRSCRTEGMKKGLSGMYGRFLWVQHMRQTLALESGEAYRSSSFPPDPVFPSVVSTDVRLVEELREGGRSEVEAKRVLEELGRACGEASRELEALLETEMPSVHRQNVILEEEVPTAKGDMRMRHVTGQGARIPGPNPNASYKLRYTPSKGSGEKDMSLSITGAHLDKNWRAYCSRVAVDIPVWDSDFLRRLFCVLSRYETLSASSDGYQMAFPASGFNLLRQLLAVECECFASPLNNTLPRFCSVAFDTDKFFGSEGNFFLSNYRQGSFEANPPFVEEVMERMVDHIHSLLKRATGPMSFSIIVPGWDDAKCMSYQHMKASPFARPSPGFYLTLLKGKHNYRPGMQHRQDVDEKPSNCNSFLFVLQNDLGAATWPVTKESLSTLQKSLEYEARLSAERI